MSYRTGKYVNQCKLNVAIFNENYSWKLVFKEFGYSCIVQRRNKANLPFIHQCFLDMTFGAGGHTKAVLQKAPDIKIYALDRDPTAFELAQQLSESHPWVQILIISISVVSSSVCLINLTSTNLQNTTLGNHS